MSRNLQLILYVCYYAICVPRFFRTFFNYTFYCLHSICLIRIEITALQIYDITRRYRDHVITTMFALYLIRQENCGTK